MSLKSLSMLIDIINEKVIRYFEEDYHSPALAYGISIGGMKRLNSFGVSSFLSEAKVTNRDSWHIGSCSKHFTAYLIDTFKRSGELNLGDKLSRFFTSSVEVTVKELLCHVSGMMAHPNLRINNVLSDITLDPIEGRKILTAEILSSRMNFPKARGDFCYSNFGYCILGAIIDQVCGSYEKMLKDTLNRDCLNLEFGPPPRIAGHYYINNSLRSIGTQVDNHPLMNPAGNINMCIEDWLRHLESVTDFRYMINDPYSIGYSTGGMLVDNIDDETILSHTGSNGFWFSSCLVHPQTHTIFVVCSNWGGIDRRSKIIEDLCSLIREAIKSDSYTFL